MSIGPMVQRKQAALLTGFDASGGETINPRWLAVKALHGRQIASHRFAVRVALNTQVDAHLSAGQSLGKFRNG